MPAVLYNRVRRKIQPTQGIYEVDLEHPLTKGLVFTSVPGLDHFAQASIPFGSPADSTGSGGGWPGTGNADPGADMWRVSTSQGLAWNYLVNNRICYNISPLGSNSLTAYTMMFLGGDPNQATRKQMTISDEAASAFPQIDLALNCNQSASAQAGTIAGFEYSSGINIACDSGNAVAYTDGTVHLYALVRNGSNMTVWRDAINITVNQTAGAGTIALNPNVSFGSVPTASSTPNTIVRGWVFNRALTQGELEAWADNPWQDSRY